MKRASFWTWAGASLLLLALFATPAHLAVEAHEWHHDDRGEEHPHDADGDQHPAVDHELIALLRVVKVVPPALETVAPGLPLVEPEVQAWVPPVDVESNGPPDLLLSPPRSPRAPPL